MMRKLMTVFGVLVLGMALLTTVASAGGPPSGDLVSSIVKAPIVPDGTVAGVFDAKVLTGFPQRLVHVSREFSGNIQFISQLPDVGYPK